jgi:hypothetical protein
MSVNFINSDRCVIDGKEMIYFKHPNNLIDEIEKTLLQIGAEKFFSSPEQSIQKKWEGLAEYFFTLALKKGTGIDWYIRQPADDPPDFELYSIKDNPIEIMLDRFELVEIPAICKDFEGAANIVQRKINKKYSENYSLLIFINNEKSKEWARLFTDQIKDYHPFKGVWVIYLLWYKGKKDLYGSVVYRLRPFPIMSINADLNDIQTRQLNSNIPNFMEEIKIENNNFINFKSAFSNELVKKMKRILLDIKTKRTK